jgi:diaminopimelate epimerase
MIAALHYNATKRNRALVQALETQESSTHMTIAFVKMHGTGNDFVVLDNLASPLPGNFDFSSAALELCARRFGIGGDGLLLLDKSENAPIKMRMWNPDGTEDMCGNGLRCIAKLAHERGYVGEEFLIETLAGLRRCAIVGDKVRVEMGAPVFAPQQIPTLIENPIEYSLPVNKGAIPHVTTLSTGSTHTVVFTDKEISETAFQTLSPAIENHYLFPERTTVLWSKIEGRDDVSTHIAVRIWERGVGETLACGTGACAVAVAAQKTGRAGENVVIKSRGGELQISWREGSEIQMTGGAEIVCEGAYSLKQL